MNKTISVHLLDDKIPEEKEVYQVTLSDVETQGNSRFSFDFFSLVYYLEKKQQLIFALNGYMHISFKIVSNTILWKCEIHKTTTTVWEYLSTFREKLYVKFLLNSEEISTIAKAECSVIFP